MWGLVRWILASITLAVVMQIALRNPRAGAFILSLPILSIIAMVLRWQQSQDLSSTTKFARENLILVPLNGYEGCIVSQDANALRSIHLNWHPNRR